MIEDQVGAMLALRCQRIDCPNSELIEIAWFDESTTVRGLMPEGWGFDKIDAANWALHCPDHRG